MENVAVRVEQVASNSSEWDQFVEAHPGATFCHLAGWARVIERVWKHPPCHLVARRGGAVTGILPLFHVKSLLFGSSLVSSPNAVYGSILAADADSQAAILEAAKRIAKDRRVKYLELRNPSEGVEGAGYDNLVRKDLYVTFECPITTDEDSLGKQFQRDIRRMVRVGIKNGLTAHVGREEYLDEFYQVYATSVRNLGTPVFPKRLFAQFLEEFARSSDILLVKQGDRLAGGVLSFYFRDAVMPYYGGAFPEFYRAGVNNFMYWELMRSAAARGYTRFDFGRSKKGTGAYAFKRGWAMTERELPYRFFLVTAREMPNLTPTNESFDLMIRAWKKIPLPLTTWLGPHIVRGLP